MEMIVWSEKPHGQAIAVRAASTLSIPVMVTTAMTEFGSSLFRDPAAIGVLHSGLMNTALRAVRELRIAEVRNSIFVLLDRFSKEHSDIAILLNAGADDVQPSTIDQREFQARISALGRRDRGDTVRIHSFCGCIFNPKSGSVVSQFGKVQLTTTEATVLETLLARNAVVTKEALLTALYQGKDEPASKIIDVFICKLRKKIFAICGERDVIETVWGRGFRFIPEGFVPKFKPTYASIARVAG